MSWTIHVGTVEFELPERVARACQTVRETEDDDEDERAIFLGTAFLGNLLGEVALPQVLAEGCAWFVREAASAVDQLQPADEHRKHLMSLGLLPPPPGHPRPLALDPFRVAVAVAHALCVDSWLARVLVTRIVQDTGMPLDALMPRRPDLLRGFLGIAVTDAALDLAQRIHDHFCNEPVKEVREWSHELWTMCGRDTVRTLGALCTVAVRSSSSCPMSLWLERFSPLPLARALLEKSRGTARRVTMLLAAGAGARVSRKFDVSLRALFSDTRNVFVPQPWDLVLALSQPQQLPLSLAVIARSLAPEAAGSYFARLILKHGVTGGTVTGFRYERHAIRENWGELLADDLLTQELWGDLVFDPSPADEALRVLAPCAAASYRPLWRLLGYACTDERWAWLRPLLDSVPANDFIKFTLDRSDVSRRDARPILTCMDEHGLLDRAARECGMPPLPEWLREALRTGRGARIPASVLYETRVPRCLMYREERFPGSLWFVDQITAVDAIGEGADAREKDALVFPEAPLAPNLPRHLLQVLTRTEPERLTPHDLFVMLRALRCASKGHVRNGAVQRALALVLAELRRRCAHDGTYAVALGALSAYAAA